MLHGFITSLASGFLGGFLTVFAIMLVYHWIGPMVLLEGKNNEHISAPLFCIPSRHPTENLAESGKGDARKWLDLAYAITPWLKKYYPQVNDQRLWGDALDTVENYQRKSADDYAHAGLP